MSEDNFPPIQYSAFLGADRYTAPQLVIRTHSQADALTAFRELAESSDPTDPESPSILDEILDHLQQITTAGKLKFGMAEISKPAAGGFTSDGFTPATSVDSSEKRCKHGVMKHKSGVNGQGKAYAGYFCPSFNRQDQCSPVWDN
jgi:hypothetical protein